MQTSTNNPDRNKLPNGLNDSDIEKAIKKSGYPLQTIITNKLNEKFFCQEEWSFIDKKTKDIRSLDINASMHLYDFDEPQKRVRPELNLLIECKQSELPYIFFLSPNKIHTYDYPYLSGLFNRNIIIHSNDTTSTLKMSIMLALGIGDDPFLRDAVPSSMTFSKCTRSGKEIVLSGTEGYHNLVLPLVTALKHFEESEFPGPKAKYFDVHLPFAIGIIDGPMIGVTVTEDSHETQFIPWVRVYRHESYENEDQMERKKLFAVDIVHKDYFDTYLNDHLLPFANRYAQLMLKHDNEIADGKGFVKNIRVHDSRKLEMQLEKLPNKFFK